VLTTFLKRKQLTRRGCERMAPLRASRRAATAKKKRAATARLSENARFAYAFARAGSATTPGAAFEETSPATWLLTASNAATLSDQLVSLL
jgi:hypothetical protein